MRPMALLSAVLLTAIFSVAPESKASAGDPDNKELQQNAVDAYVYAYPLITMEYTRRVISNAEQPGNGHTPMGQLFHARAFLDAEDRSVTAPNADTLYTTTFVDLSKEPYVLSLPDSKGRYYLMEMLSAWTNVFFAPGSRATGTGPQVYGLVGPGWEGTLPEGVVRVDVPTSFFWILGRTYTTGTPEDYKETHAFQDGIKLVPLSEYGDTDYVAPRGVVDESIDMSTPPRDQVNALSGSEYFELMAELLKNNPPAKADEAMVAKLATLGIQPGESFEAEKADPEVLAAIEMAPKAGVEKILADGEKMGTLVNGWRVYTNLGDYGTDYLLRAYTTYVGLGANLPEDAIYPISSMDMAGEVYSGANRYVLHFAAGEFPPVNGFWSITMYDADYYFVPNPLDRYNINMRDPLVKNADGSVDIYIQHESPGAEKEVNWLPAPEGEFVLMMRLYWPKAEVIEGDWVPPGVMKQ